MQLLNTNTSTLSTLLQLSLLFFAASTIAMPNALPQEDGTDDTLDTTDDQADANALSGGRGWEFTGWRERKGDQCLKKNEGPTGSTKVLNCTPIGPNKDAEVNGFSFDGNGAFKVCLYATKECKKVKKSVNGKNVKCQPVDGAKAYQVVRKGKKC